MGVHSPIITDPPSANARLVSFGADHVLCQRELTPEANEQIAARVARKYGADYLASLPEYDRGRLHNEAASRWLFPPCTFTYSIGHYVNGAYVAEETGITSESAAHKRCRELKKLRRGWHYPHAHRA